MIRAEIKFIICWDDPKGDLAAYRPDDYENFCCLVQLYIGPHGGDGFEEFQLSICTPKWWVENHPDEYIIGAPKNTLVVLEYDYLRLTAWLHRYVERCTGESWQEVARRLCLISSWEFEDYHP